MKWSLRTKIIAIVVLAGALPLLLALAALEVSGYRYLTRAKGTAYEREASHIALTLDRILGRDIKNLTSLISLGQIPQLIPEINARVFPPEGKAVKDLDASWAGLSSTSPEVQRITDNELAKKLRAFQRVHPLFVEVIAADSQGRLVAATGKTTDYDQSDESWWQKAMTLSEGAAFLEGLAFDSSSQTFSLDVALPVHGASPTGTPIGVIKVVINASALFASLPVKSPDFEAAVKVVDRNGRIILQLSDEKFVPDDSAISNKAAVNLNPKRAGWFLAPLSDGDKQMVGFAPFNLLGVSGPDGLISNEPLYVVVSNRASAVLFPLTIQLLGAGLGGIILIVVCSGVGLYLAQRNVIRPLIILRNATESLAATTQLQQGPRKAVSSKESLAAVARIRTGDEIEALAGDFAVMAKQLILHQAGLRSEIAEKTEELRNDLDMARELQQAFFPRKYPQVPSRGKSDALTLNFHHLYQAAMSVSGDFCDVIKLSDHRAGIFIADVMGHGTRSALVTAILRTLIQGLAKNVSDPAWVLADLNHQFQETMKQTEQLIFVTACYVVIDTAERTVLCASAGHPSPLCSNRISGVTDLFFDSLKQNPALGLMADATYTTFTRPLRAGDVFLLFTDGVTEAMNDRDEEFGQTRLRHLTETHQNHSLSVLTHAIVSGVREFTQQPEFFDDLCLVAVEAVNNPHVSPMPENTKAPRQTIRRSF